MATTNDDTRYRIGQVCDLLRGEFPDITISKLRFLQDKGIVEPERTPGGYRMYSPRDIDSLRVALHMQRDQFMPLRVIRNELQRRLDEGVGASHDGLGSAAPSARRVGTMPAAGEVRLGVEEQLVSAEALVRAANVTHEFLEACRAADIVSGRRDGEALVLFYTPDEVGLVQLAGVLATLGLDVRHLRQAATAMGRQGAIVEQYASAMLRARGEDTRERALQAVENLTSQLAEFLRIAFVRDVKLMTARATGTGRAPDGGQRVTAPLI